MLLDHEKEQCILCFVPVNYIFTHSNFAFLVKMKYFALLKTIFSELLPISPLEHLR